MECDTCKDKQRDIFKCDGCRMGLCKACAGLTSSEVKVLQLSSRIMIFHCRKCLSFETCTLLKNAIEDKTRIIEGKDEIIDLLRKKIDDLESIQGTSGGGRMSYSGALTSSVKQIQNKLVNYTLPSLIIKPKQSQSREEMESDLKKNIKPSELKIAVRGTRNTANGNLIVKCQNKQDLEALRKEAAKKMSGYEVEITKLRKPRFKITGYDGSMDKEDLESSIREQNHFININDELKITFVKKIKERFTVFGECSPSLFHRFMAAEKVFIGWERYPIYEDVGFVRCFKCQEPFHKTDTCPNQPACEWCSGNHNSRECDKNCQKQCKNCKLTNKKHKLNYKTDHGANDLDCPSYQYLLKIIRGKIDYGTVNG